MNLILLNRKKILVHCLSLLLLMTVVSISDVSASSHEANTGTLVDVKPITVFLPIDGHFYMETRVLH